ncbi:programmed cell death 6-interacting protein-like isoform X3 [Anneissia japonica]|uniref:programmed cell death 6-interacting protein-like isoform X3 n=1 Tax=Anneissia japonica TaxID=1529436 RepID=UPI0014257426|nr:programmed cell death 6-interacting protein-like isoform X3 [Anneissia japonica]
MAAFISVPLKNSQEVNVVPPLKKFIQRTYNKDGQEEDYAQAMNDLNTQRNNAVCRKLDKHENSIDTLQRYYDQLVLMESKLPVSEDMAVIKFTWQDAFDKGSLLGGAKKQSIVSIGYEKVCVLFNLAALHSNIAALQSLDDDSGLKAAAKHFQSAAGLFDHLESVVWSYESKISTPDLQPEVLKALASIMVAQAQESFLKKARQDKMKDSVVAKVAHAASDLYHDAMKHCQKPNAKAVLPKDWVVTVTAKQSYLQALAEMYQAKVCKSKQEFGQEISRLKKATTLLNAAATTGAALLDFGDLQSSIQRSLVAAKKDNDFIYHEVVPEPAALQAIGSAVLAKSTAISTPMNSKSVDLFEKLVPLAVHEAMNAFESRKSEIINREISKLRENNQLLDSILVSLNLPASIEDLSGESVPQSVLEKSQAVQAKGGLQALESMMNNLPELLTRNRELINESLKMLDEEAASDMQMKEKFAAKWTRTPSAKLTETLRGEAAKYNTILNNAIQADNIVREKFNNNKMYIEILGKPQAELAKSLPSANAASALKDSPAVKTLRGLMLQVDAIKTEREVMESELKSATFNMSSAFLSALAKDGAINEDVISNQELDRIYGPLIQQVQDSARRQESLLSNIQDANTQFSSAKQTDNSAQKREEVLRQLATGHNTFMELMGNLTEGTKFYNDLTQILVKYQGKCSDLSFARKTEKEELLRDLTQSIANQPPQEVRAAPAHHTTGKKYSFK